MGSISCLVACAHQGCDENHDRTLSASPETSPNKTKQDEKPARANEPSLIPDTVRSAHQTACPKFNPPELLGTTASKSLSEISGIVSSRQQSGVFWIHNDSGNKPQVYAVTQTGELLLTLDLPVKANDWEDIAAGNAPGDTSYLYIADTGDNLSRRKSIEIHRFKEPRLQHHQRVLRENNVETMRTHYPNGPRDAEAMFVDPRDESIYVISKPRFSWPELYRATRFESEAKLNLEATLSPQHTVIPLKWVTAADISVDGSWIALRTSTQIALFRRLPEMTVAEALNTPGCLIHPPDEKQGEAISFVEFNGATHKEHSSPPALATMSEGNPTSLFLLAPQAP